MLMAQLTDPHVMTPEDPTAALVDTATRFAAAVDALVPLADDLDLVVVTGDLVNRGTAAEYDLVAGILDRLPTRVLTVPGNHDQRGPLAAAMGARCPADGGAEHLSWVVEDLPVRVVGVDTTVPGRDDGELDDERLRWLAGVLEREPDRPTAVVMHHPPYPTGMWWMDYQGLKGAEGLRTLLDRHPQVTRVLAGHVHRATATSWGGTVLSTAASPFYTTTAPVGPVEVPEVFDGRAAVPLLRWDLRSGEVLTVELDPPGAAAVVTFPTVIGDGWDDYRRRALAGSAMPAHR